MNFVNNMMSIRSYARVQHTNLNVCSYGCKPIYINDLKNIDKNSSNHYIYNNLHFLSKQRRNNKNLVIIFHGAVMQGKNIKRKGINRTIFRGYDYNIRDTDIICITDYLLKKYNDYSVNWALSTVRFHVEDVYRTLFSFLKKRKQYKNVVFTGTSAGGYPSLKYAAIYNSVALIANSQIYLENYGGFATLKNMLEKNSDKVLYKNREIETILAKNKPKHVFIYNNIRDSTYSRDLEPLIKYIKKTGINNLFTIKIFKDDKPIPKGLTHHHVQFPNREKHINILATLLN